MCQPLILSKQADKGQGAHDARLSARTKQVKHGALYISIKRLVKVLVTQARPYSILVFLLRLDSPNSSFIGNNFDLHKAFTVFWASLQHSQSQEASRFYFIMCLYKQNLKYYCLIKMQKSIRKMGRWLSYLKKGNPLWRQLHGICHCWDEIHRSKSQMDIFNKLNLYSSFVLGRGFLLFTCIFSLLEQRFLIGSPQRGCQIFDPSSMLSGLCKSKAKAFLMTVLHLFRSQVRLFVDSTELREEMGQPSEGG